jgi:hypothetical protein
MSKARTRRAKPSEAESSSANKRRKKDRYEVTELEQGMERAKLRDPAPEDWDLIVWLFNKQIAAQTRRPSSERRGQRTPPRRKTPKGHGRTGARGYRGARRVPVEHPDLSPGDACPECNHRLRDYRRRDHIHLTGSPTITCTCYERQVLRCTGCGTTFTAPLPDGVGEEKFDATADAAIAVDKYGLGRPFHRTAKSQAWHGVPLSESTQWDRVERLARDALPIAI